MLSFETFATHIVGGGFDLQHISGSTYMLSLTVYRDCENGQAPFNDPLVVGLFDKETNRMIESFSMRKLWQEPINPTRAQCVVKVPGCTEKAFYSREITLNPLWYNNDSGYYLSWERCCRNHIIENIIRPQDASMAFYAEIPSPRHYVNSTPKLTVNPFTVLCVNNFFSYDITFTDRDGDSLVYEMITPVNGTLDRFRPNDDNRMLNAGPYETISWLPGYGKDSAIKGNPPLNIDSRTGKMTVNPSRTGVYVLAFRVSEYRNGVLIGHVNLELQFTVVDCIGNDPPVIKLFQGEEMKASSDLYVTIPETIGFRVNVQDEDELDSVVIESDLAGEDSVRLAFASRQSQKTSDYTWDWKTYCELHNNRVPKKITVTAVDKGCPIAKTSQRVFYINVLPMPLLPSTDILCLELNNNREITVRFGDSARTKPYFSSYNLYRAAGNNPFFLLDSITDRQAYLYLDKEAADYAKINYRYMMRVKNECGYEGGSSDTLGSFDQLKTIPDKQYMYNVTVRDNEWVEVLWNQTRELDFARYFLYKGLRGQEAATFTTLADFAKQTDTVYRDKAVDVQEISYCYYVIMLDTCGNIGPPGELFCTTVLRGVSQPFESHLEWQRFIASDESPVDYNLLRYLPEKPGVTDAGVYRNRTAAVDDQLDTDEGRYIYEVDVIHEPYGWNGATAISKSNREPLVQKPVVYVPNAFSPNADGYNDTWYVSDVFVKDFEIRVYNRWGQLVFETRDKNHKWNGKDLNGYDVPEDAYVYFVLYDGWDSERLYTLTGNVTVIR